MINQTINFKTKGWVTIFAIKDNGERELVLDKSNALTADAAKIIARLLSGDTPWALDRIQAFKGTIPSPILLSNGATPTVTYPADDQVVIKVVFDKPSFNDTLTHLRMGNTANNLDFSIISGLSIAKDNTLQLEVNWKLVINP